MFGYQYITWNTLAPILRTSVVIGCFLIIFASCVSLLFPLTLKSALVYIALSIGAGIVYAHYDNKHIRETACKPPPSRWAANIMCLIAIIACAIMIWQFRSSDVIRSPWNLIPPPLWILMGSIIAFLWTQVLQNRISPVSIALWGGVTSSIGALIYALGYGFDGFIHEASLRALITDGFIHPINPTYHGAYFVAAIVTLLTTIPIHILVAYGGACIWTIFLIILAITGKRLLAGTWALLLPVIYTAQYTPWMLGMVIVLGLFAFYADKDTLTRKQHGVALLFTLTTFFVHPFAGMLASILFFHGSLAQHLPKKFAFFCTCLSGIIIPLCIVLTGAGAFLETTHGIPRIFSLPPPQFNFFHDIWYGMIPLLMLVYLMLAWQGLRMMSTKTRSMVLASTSAMCLCAGITYYGVRFYNVIDSDQAQLPTRFLFVAYALAAYPVTLKIRSWYANHRKETVMKVSAIVFLTGASLGILYMSYPRTDDYIPSRSYSTSIFDLHTVHTIRTHGNNTRYIVLANQQVSGIAIREFGLQPYLVSPVSGEQLFYYAVPTGGTLYQYYLRMVNQAPFRTTAQQAAKIAGVNRVYFVVNTYWWNARHIISEAQKEATGWQWIDSMNFIAWYDVFPGNS